MKCERCGSEVGMCTNCGALSPVRSETSLAEVQEELRKVTNAHIADRLLLAQLTTLCREISDWLWDGPMTDLDKRSAFADRLNATLKHAK